MSAVDKKVILLVDDEQSHLSFFSKSVEVAGKSEEYTIKTAQTAAEAILLVTEASILVLDGNFPNDIEGSNKEPWQEVIDAVKNIAEVIIYPSSSDGDLNLKMEKYIKKKGGNVVVPNGKMVKNFMRYLKTGELNFLES